MGEKPCRCGGALRQPHVLLLRQGNPLHHPQLLPGQRSSSATVCEGSTSRLHTFSLSQSPLSSPLQPAWWAAVRSHKPSSYWTGGTVVLGSAAGYLIGLGRGGLAPSAVQASSEQEGWMIVLTIGRSVFFLGGD